MYLSRNRYAGVKALVRQIPYARREVEAEQVTQREDVIGDAGCIGVSSTD
jgi:hypothetical protein